MNGQGFFLLATRLRRLVVGSYKVLTSVGASQRMSPPSSSSSKSCRTWVKAAADLIQANYLPSAVPRFKSSKLESLDLAWSTKSKLEMLLLMSKMGVDMGVDLKMVQLLGAVAVTATPPHKLSGSYKRSATSSVRAAARLPKRQWTLEDG